MPTLPTPDDVQYMQEHIHETKVPDIIVCITILLVVTTVAVALRLVARQLRHARITSSDWWIVVALVFHIVYSAAVLWTIPYGMGKHVILVTDPKTLNIIMLIAETTTAVSIMGIKLSFLCQYVQLFPFQWMRTTRLIVAAIVVAYTICHVVSDVLQCVPVAALWDPTIKNARCLNMANQMTAMGAINILTDLAILVIPIKPIWGLQLTISRKIQTTLLLSLGAFVCIVSVIRIFYLRKISSPDVTWAIVEGANLTAIESGLGILAACIPACKGLWRHICRKDQSGPGSYGSSYNRSKPTPLRITHTNSIQVHNVHLSSLKGGYGSRSESQTELHSVKH